jgi:hypothetical protein
MTLYFTGTFLALSILLNAFAKDDTTPKTQVRSWMYLIIAAVLWPITLPSMIRKKLQTQPSLDLSETELLNEGMV